MEKKGLVVVGLGFHPINRIQQSPLACALYLLTNALESRGGGPEADRRDESGWADESRGEAELRRGCGRLGEREAEA